MGSGRHRTNVSRWRSVRQRRCHRRGTPLGGERGGSRLWNCGKEGGVAGDPSTSRSGARTFAGSPATWRLLKSSWVGGGPRKTMNRQLYGVEVASGALRHSRGNGRRHRRSVRHGLGGNEVLVGSPPHTAWRRTRAPTARALRTAASKIRRVGSEQSTPPVGQTRQLASCHGQQRPVIGAAHQLVEHVEPVPHRLPENLAQNLVHLVTFPAAYRFFSLTRGPASQPHAHIVPGTKPVMTLRCADRPCYDGERHKLIGSADQHCRSALHQPLRACLCCMRRPSDGKGAR